MDYSKRAFIDIGVASAQIARKLASSSENEKPELRRQFAKVLVHDARAMADRWLSKT
jgi:hypothetical protein